MKRKQRLSGSGTSTTIATKQACTAQEEQDFKTKYSNAEVKCE